MRRRISILGSTGSIGRNTVALVEAQGGAMAYEVVALTGARNVRLLAEQALRLRARRAVTSEPDCLPELAAALAGSGVAASAGPEAITAAAAEPADWTMSAIVGAAGLAPSLAAARHGAVLALANKESLVCAGGLLKRLCAEHGTRLLPVDSEHSAIFQALQGERAADVERIVLTASGGPFRTWTRRAMLVATPEQARSHPNWSMGQRISIDSASLFNKALEVIETHELFDVPPESIEVLIHPQSVVHSMVGFADGAVIAQLGPSDMIGPIGFRPQLARAAAAPRRAARLHRPRPPRLRRRRPRPLPRPQARPRGPRDRRPRRRGVQRGQGDSSRCLYRPQDRLS
jgi:1-deoxy-D-xylulose-5-phosphate reductoisomerase